MPNTETRPEVCTIASNLFIERSHISYNAPHQFVRGPCSLHVSRELRRLESRHEVNKCKPTPQCVIDHREGPVGCIHEPKQIYVLRHKKTLAAITRISQRHRPLYITLVCLNKHKQFAKYLA